MQEVEERCSDNLFMHNQNNNGPSTMPSGPPDATRDLLYLCPSKIKRISGWPQKNPCDGMFVDTIAL